MFLRSATSDLQSSELYPRSASLQVSAIAVGFLDACMARGRRPQKAATTARTDAHYNASSQTPTTMPEMMMERSTSGNTRNFFYLV
jgi:hypothetical protein